MAKEYYRNVQGRHPLAIEADIMSDFGNGTTASSNRARALALELARSKVEAGYGQWQRVIDKETQSGFGQIGNELRGLVTENSDFRRAFDGMIEMLVDD